MKAREIVEIVASAILLGAVWAVIWALLGTRITLVSLGLSYAWGWGAATYTARTSERARFRAEIRRRIRRVAP